MSNHHGLGGWWRLHLLGHRRKIGQSKFEGLLGRYGLGCGLRTEGGPWAFHCHGLLGSLFHDGLLTQSDTIEYSLRILIRCLFHLLGPLVWLESRGRTRAGLTFLAATRKGTRTLRLTGRSRSLSPLTLPLHFLKERHSDGHVHQRIIVVVIFVKYVKQ